MSEHQSFMMSKAKTCGLWAPTLMVAEEARETDNRVCPRCDVLKETPTSKRGLKRHSASSERKEAKLIQAQKEDHPIQTVVLAREKYLP